MQEMLFLLCFINLLHAAMVVSALRAYQTARVGLKATARACIVLVLALALVLLFAMDFFYAIPLLVSAWACWQISSRTRYS